MKKSLLKASLWGILAFSLFYSCRSDNVTNEKASALKEQIAAFSRFETQKKLQLTASDNQGTSKYVSYAKPFAEIINNYLENHPDYAEKLYKEVGEIRLDVSSQTVGELTKTVIFPVTDRNGKVVSLWGGVINENRDYVNFYNMNSNSEYVTSIKEAFQNYYNQNNENSKLQAIASINGVSPIAIKPKKPRVNASGEIESEVSQVNMTKLRPLTSSTIGMSFSDNEDGSDGGSSGRDMSGGVTVHGGGNGTPAEKEGDDSCGKNKSITDNKTFKENTTVLNGKTSDSSEFGYRMNLPVQNGKDNQFITSKAGSREVDLTAFPNTFGLMHSHYNTMYPMFSPGDIAYFNRWVNYVYNNNQVTNPGTPIPKLNDIFFTVVTSEGTYLLKFDPRVRPNQLPNYTEDDVINLNEKYKSRLDRGKVVANVSGNVTYDMKVIEKSFLEFVLKEMNMPGLKLIRVKDEGNTEFSLENGKIKENECKQ